jgi:HK97 family phage portal protein
MKPPATRSMTPARRKSNLLSFLGQRIRLTDAKFWAGFFGGENWAGEPITPSAAMQISAVWAGIRLTAQTIASMPKGIFEDTDNGPVSARGGATDALIRVSPNEDQTPMEFWEQVVGCSELVGDGFARKHFIGRRCVATTVMDPMRTRVDRNVQGTLFYRYTTDKGRELILNPPEVFHLKGFTLGGDRGMSTVSYGAQGMSLSRAAEKTAGKLFKSGLRSSGFVNTGQVLEEPDRERLNKILGEYTGAANAGGIMLLEGGMTYTALSMNAQDAELLLTRKFQIEEIGRWFGLPPILLGHAVEGQTMWGSGVDSIIQAWMTLGLNQRLVRIEQAINKRLMPAEERGRFYAKFNADALLRVNSASRATFLATMVQNGLLTRDEARELLERGKMPGGDVLTAQVNLVPLEMLGQSSDQQATVVKNAVRAWLGIEDSQRETEPSDT